MKKTRLSLNNRRLTAFPKGNILKIFFKPSFFLVFLVVLAFCGPLYGEKKARLQYIPNIPVYLTSETKIDIHQSLPGLSLATKGGQELKAVLKVSENSTHLTAVQPPFDLSFILTGLKINLSVNDEALHFDSSDEGSSLFLNQVSKMIERPVTLTVDNEYLIDGESSDLTQMTNELPVLKEVNPSSLLIELLQPIFALGGEELTVGKTFERDGKEGSHTVLPDVIYYRISNIDDYSVTAEISGEVDKKTFNLAGKVALDEKEEEIVAVSLSGQMQGNVQWNRDNAMLHTLSLHYSYSAKFRMGKFEWLVTANLEVSNHTRRKSS